MKRFVAACLLPAILSGCAITAGIKGVGQQIGPAVGEIDNDIYSIAVAKYRSAQMFKAQIDGTIVLPDLPPPPQPLPTPLPAPPPTLPAPPPPISAPPPLSGGPIVTPTPPPPISAPNPVPVVP